MKVVLWSFLITFFLGAVPMIIFSLPIFLRWLAEEDEETGQKPIFFITVKEGQARAIEWNRKFHRYIMNYSGCCFAGDLPGSGMTWKEANYWNIVPDPRPPKQYGRIARLLNLPAYEGLYWLGIPSIAEAPTKRFTWVEWDWIRGNNNNVTTEKGPIPHEKMLSYILVQSDVYFVKVPAAETKEGAPIDVKMLFTINIVNPYKAEYRAQDWLELVTNQAEGDVRTFVGTEKVLDVLTVSAGDQEGVAAVTISEASKKELEEMLAGGLSRYKDEFGVNVSLSQIQSVEPAGPGAAELRNLIITEFRAKMDAKRVTIGADAKAYEITKIAEAEEEAANRVLGAIAAIPGGQDLFRSQQIGKLQSLRTLVEGDGKDRQPKIVISDSD